MIKQSDMTQERCQKLTPYIKSELQMKPEARGRRTYHNQDVCEEDFRIYLGEDVYDKMVELEKAYFQLHPQFW